jgi:hypothetical protein
MQIQGAVVDETTGDGIPRASVLITDGSGKPSGQGTTANDQGVFYYDGSALDTAGYLLFSSIGYQSAIVHYSAILENGFIALQRLAQELPGVTVTPPKKQSSAVIWLVLLVAAGIAYSSHKK